MVTNKQIRAARAMLGWSQDDLAKASGVSRPTLNNFENDVATPKTSTLELMKKALEEKGILFLDGQGVRLSEERVWVIDRTATGQELFEDILSHINDGDEILWNGVDEAQAGPGVWGFADFDVQMEKKGGQQRVLIAEGDTHMSLDPSCYRWVSQEFFTPVLRSCIYADRVAFVTEVEQDSSSLRRIVIIHDAALARGHRQVFNYLWDNGKKPVVG